MKITKLLVIFWASLLWLSLGGSAYGQESGKEQVSKSDADQALTRRDASKDAKPAIKSADLSTEERLSVLNERVEKLEAIIQQQQRIIEELQHQRNHEKATAAAQAGAPAYSPAVEAEAQRSNSQAGQPETSNSVLAAGSTSLAKTNVAATKAGGLKPQKSEAQESPLSFRIGSAYITPVGFMDFTAFFRSTNTGSGISTTFGNLPFNNTIAGKLTETRLSAQNSRIGFRVDAKVKDASVIGYLESDFLGVTPGNVAVSTHSGSLRLRVFWADVRKGKFEILGGQSWSMLTPNRKGLSPIPGDIFYTQNVDLNYQVGLVWARDPQFRFIYHPTDSVAMGLSLESPEQYIGGSAGGGLVTLPSALATPYSNQLNNGNTGLAVPNLHPDVVVKIAFDSKLANRDFHLEAGGVVRSFRLYNPLNQNYYTATGGGGSFNFNFELVKNLRLISNNYYSDGGGRWIFGQAPDLIVRSNGSPSLIHSGSTVAGIEIQAKNTQLYGYYGGAYIQRNVAIDPASGKLVGYGYTGSPSGHNRTIQEATVGFTETFWRDPKYGALQLMGQYSYVIRHPWDVVAGQPSGAHTNMVFLNLRYLLPGSAPKIK